MGAFVYSGITSYVNRLIRKRLYAIVQARPLFWFITANDQSNLDALIRAQKNPNDNFKSAVRMGNGGMGLAQLERVSGSLTCEFRYKFADATAGANVPPGQNTPVANVYSEDLFGNIVTAWSLRAWPLRIREDTFENAQANPQIAGPVIGQAVEEAVAATFDKAFTEKQAEFWSGTLTATQQGLNNWDGNIGVTHWISDGTTSGQTAYATVGRVNRSSGDGTVLQSKVNVATTLAAAGTIPSTKISLSLIRQLRTNDTFGGLANKNPDAGTLAITTSDLWNALADEAEGQHTIFEAGQQVPGITMSIGSKFPVICKDMTYITYDQSCPSGELYMFTPGSFIYEIQGGNNYAVSDWRKKHETEEGAPRYRWALVTHKDRFTCTKPWENSKTTALTAV